jgi:hypothetical protein
MGRPGLASSLHVSQLLFHQEQSVDRHGKAAEKHGRMGLSRPLAAAGMPTKSLKKSEIIHLSFLLD